MLRRATCLVIIFSLQLTPFFVAQTKAQQSQDDDEVVRVRTDLIVTPFFVTDRTKRTRVLDLQASDFVVRDNGQAVAPAYFAQGNRQVALTFVLDASGSAQYFIQQQQEAARNLFAQFGAESYVSVVRFTEQPVTVVGFTRDAERIQAAFALPATRNARSAIFDAALYAVRAYDSANSANSTTRITQTSTARRILILITDGLDTISRANAGAVVEQARRANVSLYVIYIPLYAVLNGRFAPRPVAKGFREIAKRTGGIFFTADVTADSPRAQQTINLAPVFQAINSDLASQYLIGHYTPESARTRGFHQVSISVREDDANASRRDERRRLRVELLRDGYTLDAARTAPSN